MNPQVVLCDIEGTTTALSFVRDVLFPLSAQRLKPFLAAHWNTDRIRIDIESVRRVAGVSVSSPEQIAEILLQWIREDRKDSALKAIQGKIWKEAYESGHLLGHVYPDVPPHFRKWNEMGIRVCIFSSGSIEAQRLLFRYSEAGDLTPFIDSYFDTATGPKKELSSYAKICSELKIRPAGCSFLSDVEDELNAARDAGMCTAQILREGVTMNSGGHPAVDHFDQLGW